MTPEIRADMRRIIEAGKWEIQKHDDVAAVERVLAWLDAQEREPDLSKVCDAYVVTNWADEQGNIHWAKD